MAEQHVFHYGSITILKDHTLGHGSYGAVYKAKCDQLTCAAKVLHPTIVDALDPGSERILQMFRQECDFLNQIRHPHIVQYMGVCRDPDSNLPVLLMELLDGSLTKMLEQSQHPISYCIQVDLCHHIALAIAYLHSNGIIHRDLSGNNVLVIAGRRAKVTDFGMSRIVGTDHRFTPLTLSLCPGTVGYMSPESLKEPPRYTEKLDVFSQGVIMIQVCTRQFPEPGPAVKEMEDPQSPTGTKQVPVLEPERRKKHIDMIDPTHPLLPIALECLEYRERDRPTAEELCERLADLKENQQYVESSQTRSTTTVTQEVNGAPLHQELDELARELEAKDHQLTTKDRQIAIKDQEIAVKDQQIAAKDQEIALKDQQIAATIKQLQQQNHDLRMQVEAIQGQLKVAPDPPHPPKEIKVVLQSWRFEGRAPFRVARSSTVVVGSEVYVCSGNIVYSYNTSSDGLRWNTLPKCPQSFGSLVVIKGLLTMVGGTRFNPTNKVVSLTGHIGKWVELYPPMLHRCCHNTAVTYENYLIVAGGSSSDFLVNNMDIVQVLWTDRSPTVWSTASKLPHPFASASSTIINDRLYLLGGNDRNDSCQSVFSCSLPELIQSCATPSHSPKNDTLHVWVYEAYIPVYGSTCVTIHGQLVAIGGRDKHNQETKAVYKFNTHTKSWTIIGYMPTARRSCCVAVVEATNEVIVVGGKSRSKTIDVIEIAEYNIISL